MGDLATIDLLIKQGADVQAKVPENNVFEGRNSPLHLAKTAASAKLLLDRGANKDEKCNRKDGLLNVSMLSFASGHIA
jgi:hypothetical protein